MLTFAEMWRQQQQDDINYYQMRDYHGAFDTNKDMTVSKDELEEYFTSTDELDKIDEFLSLWSTSKDGDESNFWQTWGRMNWIKVKESRAYIKSIRDTGIIPDRHLAADVDKDGVISEQEVIDMYGQSVLDELERYYEGDNSQMRDPTAFAEFLHQREIAHQKLRYWWARTDGNCDGQITRYEIGYKYSHKLRIYDDKDAIDQKFAEIDEDQDGSIGFKEMCKNVIFENQENLQFFCGETPPANAAECFEIEIRGDIKRAFDPERDPEWDGQVIKLADYRNLDYEIRKQAKYIPFFFELHDVDGDNFVVYEDILRLENHLIVPTPTNLDEQIMSESPDSNQDGLVDWNEFKNAAAQVTSLGYITQIEDEVLLSMYGALKDYFGDKQ